MLPSLARRLARLDGLTVAVAAVLLPATHVLVGRSGLARTRSLLNRFSPLVHIRVGPRPSLQVLVRSVDAIALRMAPERTCLARALVLSMVLAAHGHRSELRIGARRDGESIVAHAWVEVDGVVFDGSHGGYTELGSVS